MDETYDIFQAARDGALAVRNADGGRSAHLINEVAAAMRSLSVDECEWLSIAVSNGAFSRQLEAPPKTDVDVSMISTPEGEVWDI